MRAAVILVFMIGLGVAGAVTGDALVARGDAGGHMAMFGAFVGVMTALGLIRLIFGRTAYHDVSLRLGILFQEWRLAGCAPAVLVVILSALAIGAHALSR